MDARALKHAGVTEAVIGVFYQVYNELGRGFLESVYEHAMGLALTQAGLNAVRQSPIRVWFRGQVIGEFRADLVVENSVLVELKAAVAITPDHQAQLLNYLRATEFDVGLILNFGPRPEFKRMVFSNSRKHPAAPIRGSMDDTAPRPSF